MPNTYRMNHKMRSIMAIVFILAVALISGCGSAVSVTDQNNASADSEVLSLLRERSRMPAAMWKFQLHRSE